MEQPFEAVSELGGGAAHVRFTGTFEGTGVIWDAKLQRLAPGERRFIDIGEPADGRVPVTIGLPVARIDHPTVLKAMVMMRQYKRLQRGRHEFGAAAP